MVERGEDNKVSAKLRTEAYYCTGQLRENDGPERIKGTLTISDNLVYFEPHPGTEEKWRLDEIGLTVPQMQGCIDMLDIESVQKIRGLNSSGEYVEDLDEKANYVYDYYL